jgi:hypothetical protein
LPFQGPFRLPVQLLREVTTHPLRRRRNFVSSIVLTAAPISTFIAPERSGVKRE